MTILETTVCIIYVLISGHLVHSPVVFYYTSVSDLGIPSLMDV